MRTLFISIISLLAVAFLLPQPVSAESSSSLNIRGVYPGEAFCEITEGGPICCTGLMCTAADAIAATIGGGGRYTAYANVTDAISKGNFDKATQLLAREKRSEGLLTLLENANFAMMQQRPASGILFALDRVNNVITPAPVYAGVDDGTGEEEPAAPQATGSPQPYFPGTGFILLQPIQAFWGWSVTVSLSFMVLIIIGVAFALMFRAQIDNGVVLVQLQNAIPGIVMAMILIPLSYPISGMFIDGITLATNVYHDFMFGPAGPGRDVYTNGTDQFNDGRPAYDDPTTRGLYADDWRLNVFRFYERISVGQVASAVEVDLCSEGSNTSNCVFRNSGVLNLVNFFLGVFFGDDSAGAVVLGPILNLLFGIVAIIVSFRIAKRLLVKLLTLMFMPIIAPFIFATLAIPGQGTKNLVQFLKQMGAASLFFIVTYIIFTTSLVFTNQAFFNSIPNADTYRFRPPLLGDLGTLVTDSTAGAVNESNTSMFLLTIVGAFLFLATPKILDNIDEALGIERSLIPKALQPFVDDIRYSSDYAFRTAVPGVAAAAYSTATGVSRNTIGRVGRYYGSRRTGGDFDKTNVEKDREAFEENIAEMQRQIESTNNPVTKNALRAQMAIARQAYNARLGATGGKPIETQAGEKAAAFDVEVVFEELQHSVRNNRMVEIVRAGGLEGTVNLAVQEGASAPAGVIKFNVLGTAAGLPAIAKLNAPNRSGDMFVVLRDTSEFDLDSSGKMLSIKGKSFTGGNKVVIKAKVVYGGTGTVFQGYWTTGQGGPNVIQLRIGDGGIKKKFWGFSVT